MRKLFILLSLFIYTVVIGATRTASVSGAWNNTATWGGSAVPIAGDNAYINGDIIVTIPLGYAAASLNVIVGLTANTTGTATLIINGSLTIGGGGYFKFGGSASHDAVLTLGPGGSLVIPGECDWDNGWVNSTATTASPFVISGAGFIQSDSGTGVTQGIGISNVCFQNTGVISWPLGNSTGYLINGSYCVVANCMFVGQRYLAVGTSSSFRNTVINFTNSDFRDFNTSYYFSINRANGGGNTTYQVTHCTFSQASNGVSYFQINPGTSTNLLIANNVFDNANIQEAAPGGSIITNNFQDCRDSGSTSFVIANNGVGTTITRNYLCPRSDNQTGFEFAGTLGSGKHILTYNVFEGRVGTNESVVFTDKPDFLIPTTATPLPCDVVSNLICYCGETCVGIATPNWQTLNCKNNTVAVITENLATSGGSLFVEENANASTGTMNYANNLERGNQSDGNGGGIAIDGAATATQTITYSDYNDLYNIAHPYEPSGTLVISTGNTSKVVPGSHDIATDPRFFDQTRGVAAWNQYFGSGMYSTTNAIAWMLQLNGYRGSPNYDQNGTTHNFDPGQLLDWVRHGFMATVPSLKHAGDPADGSPDIGIGYTPSVAVLTGMF